MVKKLLIALLVIGGCVAIGILGSSNVTADGTVTIPTGCNYVVALCTGAITPPYLNGNLMDTYASVAAEGVLTATSVHVRALPYVADLPYSVNGADTVTFVFFEDAICSRAGVVKGYNSAAGSLGGTLLTSTSDIVLAIGQAANGTISMTGDGGTLTLFENSPTRKVGWLAPGDSSLTCSVVDGTTASGYWYQPPPVWHAGELLEDGYWTTVSHLVTYRYDLTHSHYHIYIDGIDSGQTSSVFKDAYYIYQNVWVPARYSSGYWTYPAQQWIQTGLPGQVSVAWISVADTMIGGIYVSRPLIC